MSLPLLGGGSGAGAIGAGGGATASNFLARTSGLDATHINAYTALLNGLDTDGITAKLDMLHIYATQDSTTALLNLVSTSHNGTSHGSPTFTADRGFTGVEASSTVYIDLDYTYSASPATLYTQNTAHLSAWVVTNGQSANAPLGLSYWPLNEFSLPVPRYTDDKAYCSINDTGGPGVTNTDSRGHFIANRSASGATQLYKNASSILTGTTGTLAPRTEPFYSLANNYSGSGTDTAHGYSQQVAMVSGGGSLDATQATNFYNRLRTYMTAVGVP